MAIVFIGKLSVLTGLEASHGNEPVRSLTVWKTDVGDVVVVIGAMEGSLCPVLPRSAGIESLVGFSALYAGLPVHGRSGSHVQWFALDDDGAVNRLHPTWTSNDDWRPSKLAVLPLDERDDMTEVVKHLAAGYPPPISISFACAAAAAAAA